MRDVDKITFGFPFAIGGGGGVVATGGDEAIRGKIIQVLFTAPGERVHKPAFGCGLFNMVFEPNDAVMAAAMEFTVGQSLAQWLRDDLVVDAVTVTREETHLLVQVAYTRKQDRIRQAVRIQFT